MPERPRVTLFCEDRDHEQFVRALVARLASDLGLRPVVDAPSARGGHGRAVQEFKLWQSSFLGPRGQGVPDLLVLIIDSNCHDWSDVRKQLAEAVDESSIPLHAIGCPNPHIERWYIADPSAFLQVVGAPPAADPGKCERHIYKRLVHEAAEAANLPLLTGTADLAPDLVATMDLYRAGKNQSSLGHFIDDLGGALRQLAAR